MLLQPKVLLLSIPFIFSACMVSKKKYEAVVLQNEQLNHQLDESNAHNKDLKGKLDNNIAEFEQMKNELHKSNAIMSDDMSDLLIQVTSLTDKNTQLQSKLDQTIKSLQSQTQSSLTANDQIETLEQTNAKLKRDTASIRYALDLSKKRYTELNNELEIQKNRYNTLSIQSQSTTKELAVQKQKLIAFEQELIQNKQNMEIISNSLIELRKQMLSAKTAGTTIDPNKNVNIDKMAKALGHY